MDKKIENGINAGLNEAGAVDEQKEKESDQISIVYRDNELFRTQIPNMVEIFESWGKKVKVHSFPIGSFTLLEDTREGREEKKKWLEDNLGEMAKGCLLTDRTIRNNLPFEFYALSKKGKMPGLGYLDDIMQEATIRALMDQEVEDAMKHTNGRYIEFDESFSENLELTGKAFSNLIQKIIEKKESMPQKVFLITHSLKDHAPLVSEENNETSAQTVKQWIINGGIPEEIIEIMIAEDHDIFINPSRHKEFFAKINQEGSWIIADRHCLTLDRWHEKVDRRPKAKILNLPLESFYVCITELGVADVKPDNLKEKISLVVEKRKKFFEGEK